MKEDNKSCPECGDIIAITRDRVSCSNSWFVNHVVYKSKTQKVKN
jgi:ribosomal protein S27AE